MGDKIAFVIPGTLEEALWAIPCISQHLENRLVTKRGAEKVYCFCPIPEIGHLFEACWHGMVVGNLPIPEEIRNEVDVLFEFNPEKAYFLTRSVGKHIVEAYGTLLGTVAMSMLPPIVSKAKEVPGDVLVVGRHKLDEELYTNEWDHAEDFVRMGTAFGIPITRLDHGLDFRDMVDSIAKASVVVGIRGTPTLVAASLGKTVMELSPDGGKGKNWMSKWEDKRYRMMYGELADMDAIFVWERTRILVEEVSRKEARQWERRALAPVKEKENVATT